MCCVTRLSFDPFRDITLPHLHFRHFSQQLTLDYRCIMTSFPTRPLPPAFAGVVSGPRPLLSRSSDTSSATTAAITTATQHPSSCSPASLSPSSSLRRFKSSSTRRSSPRSKLAPEVPIAQQVFARAEGRVPYFCIRGYYLTGVTVGVGIAMFFTGLYHNCTLVKPPAPEASALILRL